MRFYSNTHNREFIINIRGESSMRKINCSIVLNIKTKFCGDDKTDQGNKFNNLSKNFSFSLNLNLKG